MGLPPPHKAYQQQTGKPVRDTGHPQDFISAEDSNATPAPWCTDVL